MSQKLKEKIKELPQSWGKEFDRRFVDPVKYRGSGGSYYWWRQIVRAEPDKVKAFIRQLLAQEIAKAEKWGWEKGSKNRIINNK